ncbi:MAG: Holliday junction branch migration protein RuvA [Clostridia bacterium]|nr:Holliday junction branch migration protein RuvA [Clostridia bacterium]
MFYYLKGALVHLENGLAVLDVGGVGYMLTVSGTTYDAMPPNRSVATPPTVCLYTHMAVREDDVELFGFATQEELASFKLLISVSGIGPKAAMSILTLLSPEKFALAVCTEDKKTIAKANGIGPKTAARVILELKDKLMKETDLSSPIAASPAASTAGAARGKLSEAVDALVVLGYSRAEASGILKDLDPSLELEDLIRAALKKLMKF